MLKTFVIRGKPIIIRDALPKELDENDLACYDENQGAIVVSTEAEDGIKLYLILHELLHVAYPDYSELAIESGAAGIAVVIKELFLDNN